MKNTVVLLLLSLSLSLESACQNTMRNTEKPQVSPLPKLDSSKDVKPIEVAELVNVNQLNRVVQGNTKIYLGKDNKKLNGYYTIQYGMSIYNSDNKSEYIYLAETGHIINGLKEGLWNNESSIAKKYLSYTEIYKKGLLDGEFKVYNNNGDIRYECLFNDGTGLYKMFYYNSNISSEGMLINGLEDGKWIYYDESGKVAEEKMYNRGLLINSQKH